MTIEFLIEQSPSREERLEYTEEEECAIMYFKIVLELEWRAIVARMAARFPQRPRTSGGLSSKYYRIRDKWEMNGARGSGDERSRQDVDKVSAMAMQFGEAFLRSLACS
jgi:hypothetical protein